VTKEQRKQPFQKLYIDSEGVKRGYYVYLHKDRATGKVFYVGKGSGKRAYDTDSRSEKWCEMVKSFSEGWDVEIVDQDMSELEAFELEAELVDKYREAEADGKGIANVGSGGETTLSSRLSFSFDDHGWSKAYSNARVFKEFQRNKEEALASDFDKALKPICDEIELFKEEVEESANDKVQDHAEDLDFYASNLRDEISEFLCRRLSWKDLALFVEEMIEDVESTLEDMPSSIGKVRTLCEQLLAIAVSFLNGIDSGNRKKAEEEADRLAKQDFGIEGQSTE
jgi:hypothetical protein